MSKRLKELKVIFLLSPSTCFYNYCCFYFLTNFNIKISATVFNFRLNALYEVNSREIKFFNKRWQEDDLLKYNINFANEMKIIDDRNK